MAYDEDLAGRIRDRLAERSDVVERRMFGGLAFLVGGHLAVAASGQGGALVRVEPDATDALVAKGPAEVAVMRGRPMAGWLRVGSEHLRTSRQLDRWIRLALAYVETLPEPKQGRRTR